MLDNLGRLTATRLLLWQAGEGHWNGPHAGMPAPPPWPPSEGPMETAAGEVTLLQLDEAHGVWVTIAAVGDRPPPAPAADVAAVAARLVHAALEVEGVRDELSRRCEEIDLLYGISEVFGRTVGLEEAAAIIVREVSAVVGARRASIMVHDETAATLRTVAARGFDPGGLAPVPVEDPLSVAARVFRLRIPLAGEPAESPDAGERGYQGESYLSVPIEYRPPGGEHRCVGVINLTDRQNGEPFTVSHRRLVEAIAFQIGVAIEQARQVARDRAQQRLRHELVLARDLQRKLLPLPDLLHGDAQVAVACHPVESIGGDFYTFSRLGVGCVSVMVGDVSSHGLSAALVMAVVLATAGIHAPASVTPDETLTAMGNSLAQKLSSTDSYLTVFYGILDPNHRRLTYANAGHPHAFRIPGDGPPERLDTTAPPLGLGAENTVTSRQVEWQPGEDLLCLWTDGLVDAVSEQGEPYGEGRLLGQIGRARREHPDDILRQVLADADAFAGRPADDRTLLVLRI